MADDDEIDYRLARRELHEAENELRKLRGLAPLPFAEDKSEGPHCSFCGKGKEEAENLIAGPSVYICSDCVFLCHDIIIAERKKMRIHLTRGSA